MVFWFVVESVMVLLATGCVEQAYITEKERMIKMFFIRLKRLRNDYGSENG
jgi:hypothetical protein